MKYIIEDKKYKFKFAFDTNTGAYVRTGILDENGKIDLNKFSPITYDPVHHVYRKIGAEVGKAFCDGKKLK